MFRGNRDSTFRQNRDGDPENRRDDGRRESDNRSLQTSNSSATPRYASGQQTRIPDAQPNNRASGVGYVTQNASWQAAQSPRQPLTNAISVPINTQQVRRQSVTPALPSSSFSNFNSQVSVRPFVKDADDTRTGVSNRMIIGPPEALVAYTDPQVYKQSKRPVQRAITSRETARKSKTKKLNSKFKRGRQREWFTPGRVFVLWYAEPANASTKATSGAGSIIRGNGGSSVCSKLRRFIVYKDGRMSCTAFGIFSYQDQASGGSIHHPSEHGIVHIGRDVPQPFPAELDRAGRSLLGHPAVRINPDDQGEVLRLSSRINYGKVYNVEYNLPIRNIGKVVNLDQFIRNAENGMGFGPRPSYYPVPDSTRMSMATGIPAQSMRPISQQGSVNMSYQLSTPSSSSRALQYPAHVNDVTQRMATVSMSSNSATAASAANERNVSILAARMRAKRSDLGWDRSFQLARQKLDAMIASTSSGDEDDEDDDEDEEEDEDED